MAEEDGSTAKPKKASAFKRLFAFARGEEIAADGTPAKDWVDATADVAVGLDDMLAGDAGEMPDHLHIVSLKALRVGLGEFEWQRRDERIRLLSEGLIRRHLPNGASFRRFGEDAFVLAFPRQTEEQAGALTLTIADEMGYRLIGEQFQGSKDVRIGIAKADTQLLVSGGELDPSAVDLALQSSVPVETDFSQPRPDLDDDEGLDLPAYDVIDDREDDAPGMEIGDIGAPQKRKPGAEPNWSEMQRDKKPAVDAPAAADEAPAKKPDDPQWSAQESEDKDKKPKDLDWVGMGAVAGASPIAVGLPEDLFAVAHPAWSAVSARIDIHVIAPAVRRGDRVIAGTVVLGKKPSLQALAVTDRLMVDAAARMLGGANRAPGAVVVPIHWETMNEARFPTLNPAFGRIDDTVRKAKLLIELTRVPEGVAADRLRAAIQRLKTFSRGVLVRDSLGMGRHALFGTAGAAAVGIDLFDENMFHDGLPLLLADEMEQRDDVPGYLWGVRRKGDLLAAVEAGFRFVAGPALKPARQTPTKAVALPKATIVKTLAKYRRKPGQGAADERSMQGIE